MQRVVVLGAGTGVGKTHLTRALATALRAACGRESVLCLKPVETGAGFADAVAHQAGNPFHVEPHPLYGFDEPISPHLAARRNGLEIRVGEIVDWVAKHESQIAISDTMWPYGSWVLLETAGGALSPLAAGVRNFELARALEPATWILVAANALGALNQVDLALTALRELGRVPDFVVLSTPPGDDLSRASNAAELSTLGIVEPALVLGPGEDDAGPLAAALLARRNATPAR